MVVVVKMAFGLSILLLVKVGLYPLFSELDTLVFWDYLRESVIMALIIYSWAEATKRSTYIGKRNKLFSIAL